MDGSALMPESGKKKVRQQCDDGGVEDRLSSLPDNLIHHIFSFIPTKYVVATSVLSTRWYSLWTSSSNLDFSDQLLHSPGIKSSDPMVHTSFMNFVDGVLSLHHAPTLTKFSILCQEVYADTRVSAWISAAFRCNVRELILVAPLYQNFLFPRRIIHCESLTRLKINLDDVFHLKISNSMCFPNLKYLDLSDVWFCGDHSTRQVLFSFPVLEEFTINELKLLKITTVTISAPLLKRLRIDHCDEGTAVQDHEKIIIYAQSLVFLYFSETLRYEYYVHGKSSVLEASINVSSVNCLIQILSGICNVEHLTLSDNTTEALANFDAVPHLPKFSSLVDLTVILPITALTVGPLISLLHKMPNIESLTIDDLENCEYHEIGVAPGVIPQYAPSHLKSIQLCGFGASEFDLYLVRFFLQNARSLEWITVTSSAKISEDPKKQVEVTKQLLMIPRASPHCMIHFS